MEKGTYKKPDVRLPLHVSSTMWTRIPSNASLAWADKLPSVWLMSFILTLIIMSSFMTATSLCNRRLSVRTNAKLWQMENPHLTEVFYHKIIRTGERNGYLADYRSYLSHMSTTYPNLHFNLIFLTDDWEGDLVNSFLLTAYESFVAHLSTEQKLREQLAFFASPKKLKDFCNAHKNIKISLVPLSKYLDHTTLKYVWRFMPRKLLMFYVRVVAVLTQGGTALDLDIYNDLFSRVKMTEKVGDVLQSYNNQNVSSILAKIHQFSTSFPLKKKLGPMSDPKELSIDVTVDPGETYLTDNLQANPELVLNPVSNFVDNQDNQSIAVSLQKKVGNVDDQNGTKAKDSNVNDTNELLSVRVIYLGYKESEQQVTNKLVLAADGSFMSTDYSNHPFLNRIINRVGDYRLYLKRPQVIIWENYLNCDGFNGLFSFCRDVIIL